MENAVNWAKDAAFAYVCWIAGHPVAVAIAWPLSVALVAWLV